MGTRHNLTGAHWRKSSYSGTNGGDCVECTVTDGAAWRKSTYSGSTGGDCVECTVTDGATWRKSTYSGNTGGECVEVADGLPGAVPVRDSKNPAGPTLFIHAGAWQAFVDGLR
ncbi:DUF397 domain-containing protein [Streptomyces sp. NBC_01766]|uniref:DUF397 domain-containing protein n=1 Tax=Streptomyces sp. NBC_01766 TaxID=2975936 RepID=UPI002DDA732E|nr:DUF397 domain-containing protein [Streptomyces sp. NBC_01766]WSC22702.1 DUF397 domain-containing protein [Streptomyces sp. NBC_01766]